MVNLLNISSLLSGISLYFLNDRCFGNNFVPLRMEHLINRTSRSRFRPAASVVNGLGSAAWLFLVTVASGSQESCCISSYQVQMLISRKWKDEGLSFLRVSTVYQGRRFSQSCIPTSHWTRTTRETKTIKYSAFQILFTGLLF